MSCMVDTPADDQFHGGHCFGLVHGARYTTAVFRVDNPPSDFQIVWDKGCPVSTSNTSCAVTIRALRPYTMGATVLDFDSYRFYRVAATAFRSTVLPPSMPACLAGSEQGDPDGYCGEDEPLKK